MKGRFLIPRMRKRWPDDEYHSAATKAKIKNTLDDRIKKGIHNLNRVDTCKFCNVTMQENMIIRHHNDKCNILKYIWDYKSPKLRTRN